MKNRKLKIESLKVNSFVTEISSSTVGTLKGGTEPSEAQQSVFNNPRFCDQASCPSHRFVTAYDKGGCNTEESALNCSEF